MLPLRPETQALVQQVAALSGKPLEFMRDPGLLALMYTAFKQIDPTMNSGADFDAKYKMAVGARNNLR